jgi:hypoxanthine phosphoribosyltransferase
MHAEKRWIAAEELHEDSLRLALAVLDSGFAPTLVIGLWRGGSPVAIALHEVLDYFGVHAEHLPLRTSLYSGIDQREPRLAIHGLEAIAACGFDCRRVLLVDDVFDTGTTLEQTLAALRALPAMHGAELRTATLWWKPSRNRSALAPDYWLHETDQWLVFPHELCGLGAAEIQRHKPGAGILAARLARSA